MVVLLIALKLKCVIPTDLYIRVYDSRYVAWYIFMLIKYNTKQLKMTQEHLLYHKN